MESPADILRSEHDAIRSLLSALEGMIERIRRDNAIPKDDLYDAVAVVAEFADKCHQGKEEVVLIPELVKASPRAAAVAERLKADHVAFRGHVQLIKQLLPKSRTKAVRRRIAGHLATYVRTHREHMALVDEELLPEIDRSLRPEQRARIAKEFERVEKAEIGWGMRDAYSAIIERLADVYGQ